MHKIMIIEDDPTIRDELALLLDNEGYCSVAVTDFRGIPDQARQISPDLILLDVGLPGQDGLALCATTWSSSPAGIPGRTRCGA